MGLPHGSMSDRGCVAEDDDDEEWWLMEMASFVRYIIIFEGVDCGEMMLLLL